MPFLIIALVLVILILSIGYFFYRVAFFPKRHTPEEVFQMEFDHGKLKSLDDYNSWPREELSIPSPYGYPLHALYFPLNDAKKTVIFSHGITLTLVGSIKYMQIFRSRGFNCLLYDNRFHGESGGPNCTFGYFEKVDLKTLVDWAFKRTGPGSLVGTHGESLGAVIALQHAAIDSRIAFVIADCPFSDLKRLFALRLGHDYHLPTFPLLNICRWYGKQLAGFDFEEVSPIRDLNKSSTPIFYIHGDKDRYIPPSMSVEMNQARVSGPDRLYLAPGAKHAEAYSSNPLEYENQVASFLAEIGV